MPDHDDLGSAAGHAGADREARPRLTRRSVLRGAAGAGVAGIAATALAGVASPAFAATDRTAAPAAHAADSETAEPESGEQIVVHLRDAKSGEIDVFHGTSTTRVYDRELAARLVRASR